MNEIVRMVGQAHEKKVDPFEIGDIVDVHVRIVEGDKERIQLFTGTVIARKGIKTRGEEIRGGVNASFTVRRIAQGSYGVERVFPLHSPRIEKVTVRKRSRIRRAKLYYLRDRTGKRAKLKEQRLTARQDSPKAKASSEPPADEPAGETGAEN
jgi:large subunit ribosomal protein L19